MEITMWIWICAGLAVLCFALFLPKTAINLKMAISLL